MSSRQKRIVEHVQQYGVEGLSDADILMLVVGKGTVAEREKALKRIKTLLAEREGLTGGLNAEIGELLQNEFDEELAIRLRALMEIARRLIRPKDQPYQIKSADDAARFIRMDMMYLDHEELHVLVLNTKNHLVECVKLYKGTVYSSATRTSEIFRLAIMRNCPHIIVCHNHPSGDPSPSPEDIAFTRQLVKAADLLEIDLLDHLIIGNPRYISLKETMNW
jgi:DNA repair protein RadC